MIPALEHFVEALDREASEERHSARLEPIIITIADQQELRVWQEIGQLGTSSVVCRHPATPPRVEPR